MLLASIGTFERHIYVCLEAVYSEIHTVFIETNKQDALSVSKCVA